MSSFQKVFSSSKEDLLESLIDQYGQNIKRLAFTYVKDWSTAEDITQEVFITCYKNIDEFRGESSYKTWLYKITVNKCKDLFKSKWYRFGFPVDNVMEKYFKNSNFNGVDETLVLKEEEFELSLKVLSLPSKYREIIVLFYYEQLKVREIEELTGLKTETIKSRLRRAKLMLQKKLVGV